MRGAFFTSGDSSGEVHVGPVGVVGGGVQPLPRYRPVGPAKGGDEAGEAWARKGERDTGWPEINGAALNQFLSEKKIMKIPNRIKRRAVECPLSQRKTTEARQF